MSDVNDKTTALLRAARAARPSDAARSRMSAGLAAKIAAGAGAAAAVTALSSTAKAAGAAEGSAKAALATKAATAASAATAKGAVVATGVIATAKAALVGMVLGGIVIGTATVLPAKLFSSTPAPTATATATSKIADPAPMAPKHEAATSAPAPEASAVVDAPPADAPASPNNTSVNEAQRANGERAQGDGARAQLKANEATNAAPPMSSAQAEEIAELGSAERSLNGGDPGRALTALQKMKASHPNGAMREERLAAEVISLCKLGRVAEGLETTRAFLAEFPNSVHADRVRAACVAPPKP